MGTAVISGTLVGAAQIIWEEKVEIVELATYVHTKCSGRHGLMLRMGSLQIVPCCSSPLYSFPLLALFKTTLLAGSDVLCL
jgi:hypothetical protein